MHYKWEPMFTIVGGHRYFGLQDGLEWKLAVADNSGEYPHQTDDGILWVDKSRALYVGPIASDREDFLVTVPVIRDRSGLPSNVIEPLSGLRMLIDRLPECMAPLLGQKVTAFLCAVHGVRFTNPHGGADAMSMVVPVRYT